MKKPKLIEITGPAKSGKSTLAHEIARSYNDSLILNYKALKGFEAEMIKKYK